jgi:hypothetical protein
MAITRDDIAALMKGIAPPMRDAIAAAVQPLADMIVEQRKTITRLEGRIATLESAGDPDEAAQRAIEG